MSLGEKPTVVLIGDSIRMGYQPFVTEALAGEAEIWAPERRTERGITLVVRRFSAQEQATKQGHVEWPIPRAHVSAPRTQ